VNKQLYFLAGTPGQVLDLRCPPGKQIRVVIAKITASAITLGEQFIVAYKRGPAEVLHATSNPTVAGITDGNAAIGNPTGTPMVLSIDPVTGVYTYDTSGADLCFPLPNVQWPFDIQVFAGTSGATEDSYSIFYEVSDIE